MTNSVPHDMQDLAAAYVLEALDPAEHASFERALGRSPELQKAVADYREVCALLALDSATDGPTVNEAGWRRVQRMIAQERDRTLPRGRSTRPSRGATAGWLVAAAASVAAIGFGAQYRNVQADLVRQLVATDSVRNALAARNEILDDILFAQGDQILLTSADAAEPGILVYWNRNENVMVLHAFELYPPAADRVYQLWFLEADGTVTPSDTFTTLPDGHGLASVVGPSDPDAVSTLAVSVEPTGGSPQPTTTPILVGAVDQ